AEVGPRRPAGRGALARASASRRLRRRAGDREGGVAPRLEPRFEQGEIDVADRDDVLAHQVLGDLRTAAADADRGDVYRVARRRQALAEHVARHDHQRRAGRGGRGGRTDERAAGDGTAGRSPDGSLWLGIARHVRSWRRHAGPARGVGRRGRGGRNRWAGGDNPPPATGAGQGAFRWVRTWAPWSGGPMRRLGRWWMPVGSLSTTRRSASGPEPTTPRPP